LFGSYLPESVRFSASGGRNVVDLGGVAISDSRPAVRSIIASTFSSAQGAIWARQMQDGFWRGSGFGWEKGLIKFPSYAKKRKKSFLVFFHVAGLALSGYLHHGESLVTIRDVFRSSEIKEGKKKRKKRDTRNFHGESINYPHLLGR
jgi:hypothetical protein